MEEFGTSTIYGSSTMRRKRSRPSRRPRVESQQLGEGVDPSPSSSTPPSDDAVKFSSDENGGGDGTPRRKELSLNQCVSRGSSASGPESEHFLKRSKKDGSFNSYYRSEPGRSANDNKRSSEGVLAPANWRSTSKASDGIESESSSIDPYGGRYGGESSSSGQKGLYVEGLGNDNKVKKVKLRVGGVTRTIQANSPPNGTSKGSSQPSEGHRQQHKHNFQQENFNGHHSPSERSGGLHGVPWRDFSRGGFGLEKEESLTGKMPGRNSAGKHGAESLRKSKRASKKRVLDGDFDDDDDDEIRYLEKLRTSKAYAGYRDDGEEPSKKQRKLSSISSMESYGASKHDKDEKKARSDMASDDKDYEEEEESASDGDVDGNHKKQRKESIDALMEGKREMTLTTRQRALQSSKDASSTRGSSLIEFPNGLPPAPPRKQKEKLTDVEQQLKKAEAAQRRRMQVEKAARESEAEAIRKILGQDSSRKKREDKMKKRQEELAQEKAANAQKLLSNTIRWVMGPSGTVVTFPNDMGFPSIFESRPCSYPPQRENCAGPSCSNPYKYRDSKSKLPLCSLVCYKAIQEQLTETTC
ncbi:ABC transporter F family member 4 isoform X1 [Benincasa hispida]|uniref:ABC transporter F family member 4 isoform X1 n=1 Tax=Benincasa hispida TaxID=102211 RepID=UPI00190238C5|nr:ABC transporter F family member 4 isoform X1 [Benincasa hispida]